MIFKTIILDIMQALRQYGLDTLIFSSLLMLVVLLIRYLLRRGPVLEWMKREWKRLIVENVLLFIPLGVMVPLIWRHFRRINYTMGAGLLFSRRRILLEVRPEMKLQSYDAG